MTVNKRAWPSEEMELESKKLISTIFTLETGRKKNCKKEHTNTVE